MALALSPRFVAALKKLDSTIQKRALDAIEKFEREPGLPGLNLEKLAGHENLWSIRVNRRFRILVIQTQSANGPQWTLADIGPHDIYRRV